MSGKHQSDASIEWERSVVCVWNGALSTCWSISQSGWGLGNSQKCGAGTWGECDIMVLSLSSNEATFCPPVDMCSLEISCNSSKYPEHIGWLATLVKKLGDGEGKENQTKSIQSTWVSHPLDPNWASFLGFGLISGLPSLRKVTPELWLATISKTWTQDSWDSTLVFLLVVPRGGCLSFS